MQEKRYFVSNDANYGLNGIIINIVFKVITVRVWAVFKSINIYIFAVISKFFINCPI
jgi:hypothetical protein